MFIIQVPEKAENEAMKLIERQSICVLCICFSNVAVVIAVVFETALITTICLKFCCTLGTFIYFVYSLLFALQKPKLYHKLKAILIIN